MPSYSVTRTGVGKVPQRLFDALRGAGLPVRTVVGTADDTATVLSETEGLQATLDSFVAAFDPATPTAGEQQQADDALSLQSLRDQYQTLKNGLDTIRTHQETVRGHMDTIQASANPTTANLAALQRVVDAVKQQSQDLELVSNDVTMMSNGLDRLLDTLAVFVRRQMST